MKVEKISDTIQKFDGVSYYRCGYYFQRKGKRLHRAVWEYHNGAIPSGYEVHHADGDRANNDIENLRLLTEAEHGRLHMSTPERKEKSRDSIAKASERAKAWHSTPEGAKFHSEHAKQYWENAGENAYICAYCGKEFLSRSVRRQEGNRFCCAKHRAYWRKRQGIDNETRVCPVCGEEFTVNKYAKNQYCSKECARVARWGK